MDRRSLTLVELMAVTTLMALAVGMVVIRFDGWTAASRLDSAGAVIQSAVRLAVTEARITGQPRSVIYSGHGLTVHRPHQYAGIWRWDAGATFGIGAAEIRRVLVPEQRGGKQETFPPVQVSGEGRMTPHAVVVKSWDQWKVVLLESVGDPRMKRFTQEPDAVSLDVMMATMRSEHGAP
jgi:Tfp pilus assembly protein FimT